MRRLLGGYPLQIGYVIPLPDEVRRYARRLQVGALAGRAPQEEPHVTLKQAFAARALQPWERHFDGLAAQVAPFEVEVRGIDAFPEGILFLDVPATAALDGLRRRIVRELAALGVQPGPLEDDRYRFHVTLAHGLDPAALAQARKALVGERPAFRFSCAALALVCDRGQGFFTYKEAALANRPLRAVDESA